jgi:hypothetical protein
MSTLELRRKIKRQLDVLPKDKLRSAADFIDYLGKGNGARSPEKDPRIARMRRRIRRAEAAVAAGKLIPWEQLKRKY